MNYYNYQENMTMPKFTELGQHAECHSNVTSYSAINRLYLLAKEKFASRDFVGFDVILKTISSIDNRHPYYYLLKAEIALYNGVIGDIDKYLKLYLSRYNVYELNFSGKYLVTLYNFIMRKFSLAETQFINLLNMVNSRRVKATILYMIGLCKKRRGRFVEASEIFLRLLGLKDNCELFGRIYLELLHLILLNGEYKYVEKQLSSFINPHKGLQANRLYVYVLYKLKKYQTIKHHLKRMDCDDDYLNYIKIRAQLHDDTPSDDLLSDCNFLLGKNDSNLVIINTYANILCRHREFAAARVYYKLAHDMDQRDDEIFENLTKLESFLSEVTEESELFSGELKEVDPDPIEMGFFKLYLDAGYADYTISHRVVSNASPLEFPLRRNK